MAPQAVVFVLALAAFLAILIAAWVAAVSTTGQRERRRQEEETLRLLQLEAELSQLSKDVPRPKDKWLLDAHGMEALRAQTPHSYPPLSGSQTPEEFWTYWTPDRVEEWRKTRRVRPMISSTATAHGVPARFSRRGNT